MKSKLIDELCSEYNKLSIYQVIIKQSNSSFYFWISVGSSILGYLGHLVILYKLNNFLMSSLFLIFFVVIGVIFHLTTVFRCNKFVGNKAKFRAYSDVFNFKFFLFWYGSFINEFRYQQIKSFMGHKKIDGNDKIDHVIAILETEKANWIQANWKPIAILGVVLFPLVGEYVAFRYAVILQHNNILLDRGMEQFPDDFKFSVPFNRISDNLVNNWLIKVQNDGLSLLMSDLMPFLIYLGLTLWAVVAALEKLFLSKALRHAQLIKLLRLIRINGSKG